MKKRYTYIISYYVCDILIESPRVYHSREAVLNNLYRYKNIGQLKVIDKETGKTIHVTTGYYSILNYLSKC